MMSKNKTTTFSDLLDAKYGKKGTKSRNEFESKSKAFRIGVLIKEARTNAQMTQEQLAERANTKKSYISRIERDASDIRLSTLVRIVEQGFGGRIEIRIDV